MKKQTFKLAVLAVASFGWISLATAQGPGGHMRRPGGPGGAGFGHGGPGGPPMGMLAERLGLSDEQKAQWKAIHEKARESSRPLMQAANDARTAFEKALESENPDAAAIGQAALAMRNARRDIEAEHKAAFEAVKAILTPEQLAKVEEMEKRGPRRGPRPFGPGGPAFEGPRQKGPGVSK